MVKKKQRSRITQRNKGQETVENHNHSPPERTQYMEEVLVEILNRIDSENFTYEPNAVNPLVVASYDEGRILEAFSIQ